MKNLKKRLVLAVFSTAVVLSAAAQTQPRSYYVSAGGDDESNNGRSEETPFKTLRKAVDAASRGAVKTIMVLGKLNRESEGNSEGNSIFYINNTGTAEILITGKPDTAEEKRAVLSGLVNDRNLQPLIHVSGTGPILFEHIEISEGAYTGITIKGGTVTLGTGTKIINTRGQNGVTGVHVNGGRLIMLDGATIADSGGNGVSVKYGAFTMSGGMISGNKGNGVYVEFTNNEALFDFTGGTINNNAARGVSNGGIFTMPGGEISGNANGGVSNMGTFAMSGGVISENSGSGVYIGGGVYVETEADFEQTDGIVSGNTAGDGEGEDVFRQ